MLNKFQKSKSVLLMTLMLVMVFIAGCLAQNSKPFFKEATLANNYVPVGGNTALNFIVSNPTQITFNGKVGFNYDTSCISITPQIKDVTVPNGGEIPFSVNIEIPNNNVCVGTKDIILILIDVNGNNLDYKTVEINIFKP